MKTTALIPISLLLALASGALAVGCSAAPVPDIDRRSDNDTEPKGSSSKTKKPASGTEQPAAGQLPTTPGANGAPVPPAGAPPAGTPPAGTPQDPEEQANACYLQCVAVDPAAKQVDDAWAACEGQCADAACAERCAGQAYQSCQFNPAPCQKLEQCWSQCFGNAGLGG